MDTKSLILFALCAATAEPGKDHDGLHPLRDIFKRRSENYGMYAEEFAQESEAAAAYAAIPLHQPMPVIAILSDTPLTHKAYPAKILASSSRQHHRYAKPDYQQNYEPTEYNTIQYANLNELEDYLKPYASEYQTSYNSIRHQKPFHPPEYHKPFSAMEYQKNYAMDYQSYSPMDVSRPYSPTKFAKPYNLFDYERPDVSDYRHPSQDPYKAYASAPIEPPTILYARPNENGGYTYRRKPQKPLRPKKVKRTREPIILRVHKHRVIRDRRSLQ